MAKEESMAQITKAEYQLLAGMVTMNLELDDQVKDMTAFLGHLTQECQRLCQITENHMALLEKYEFIEEDDHFGDDEEVDVPTLEEVQQFYKQQDWDLVRRNVMKEIECEDVLHLTHDEVVHIQTVQAEFIHNFQIVNEMRNRVHDAVNEHHRWVKLVRTTHDMLVDLLAEKVCQPEDDRKIRKYLYVVV